MNHHWDTWLKTTLLWGIASLLVAGSAWYFHVDLLSGIAVISFFMSVVHAVHKIIYSRPLKWKDRRRGKTNMHYYDDEAPSFLSVLALLLWGNDEDY